MEWINTETTSVEWKASETGKVVIKGGVGTVIYRNWYVIITNVNISFLE